MRIKSLLPTLRVYDLPTRSLHLPGRGRASGDRYIAEVTEEELASPQLVKAVKKKWVRILKEKIAAPIKKEEKTLEKKSAKKFEKKPVAITSPSVTEETPNNSSDE